MDDQQISDEVGTRLLFENERVRVWDLQLEPGEATGLHAHHSDYLYVVIGNGQLQRRDADGSLGPVKEMADGDVVFAEVQTAGRGRHGRTWLAPVGGSLTFSMYWSFPDGYQSMAGLSLLVGLAVCDALKEFGVNDAELKWPNDIYLQGKKLAGVLIEVEGQIGATAHCVIGVGLNVCMPDNQYDVGQPHSDLATFLGHTPDRNVLAAQIIKSLWTLLPKFTQQGFTPFVPHWEALDLYADKRIVLQMGDKRFSGIDRGEDASGALLVETQDGITRFHGGEVSLRGN